MFKLFLGHFHCANTGVTVVAAKLWWLLNKIYVEWSAVNFHRVLTIFLLFSGLRLVGETLKFCGQISINFIMIKAFIWLLQSDTYTWYNWSFCVFFFMLRDEIIWHLDGDFLSLLDYTCKREVLSLMYELEFWDHWLHVVSSLLRNHTKNQLIKSSNDDMHLWCWN